MYRYEVSYSVGNSSLGQGLQMVINAPGMAQAREMVESMNGGPCNCQIYSVILLG